MSGSAAYPSRVLIAACSSLALSTIDRPDRALLLETLAAVLPHCDGCSASVERVRQSAERLLRTKTPREESLQEIDLRRALQNYHQLAAFSHLEKWRELKKGPL